MRRVEICANVAICVVVASGNAASVCVCVCLEGVGTSPTHTHTSLLYYNPALFTGFSDSGVARSLGSRVEILVNFYMTQKCFLNQIRFNFQTT